MRRVAAMYLLSPQPACAVIHQVPAPLFARAGMALGLSTPQYVLLQKKNRAKARLFNLETAGSSLGEELLPQAGLEMVGSAVRLDIQLEI